MLVVHWSPVNNSKSILKNGIKKETNGVYCFPLTGHQSLDRWWMKALKRFRKDGKRYNGFIFRLQERDLPAYFGHFVGHTTSDKFEKPIQTLIELGKEIEDTIIWRIGERVFWNTAESFNHFDDYLERGRAEMRENPKKYKESLTDAAFMEYILEDYQIVLTNRITADRIIRVIPPMEEFGRILYKNKKQKPFAGEF
ncbi:hypothetical protein Back11_04760 [Paenibacillus baekrokdamisoli]|uniref:Uncharacterized protein n=1 Tax=Paenibacillus baekrokdamisoli TaxID=1712516 RepID=A0A3G9IZS2_9BACL|nr:hypothetical protein [Paenibacillus baekrokdamisoli]MBB3067684.1 hypothetical protein [Paenibacillus baekrokdamisoli]BBH19131.1 hypothetical protein Back11_04760 [Paenibacillus baekrokdamisoli]